MQYMPLLTAILMYFYLLFSKKQIVSFKLSQGWSVYKLLLFSSFHRGCKWEFKQLISLFEGSRVEMIVAVGYKSAISTCMGVDMVEFLVSENSAPHPRN